MKTLNEKLSNDQATKQLKQFSVAGLVCSIIGLLAFWWLGIGGIAFGARALVLANHHENKASKDVNKYRVLAIIGVLIGLADIIFFSLSK